MTVIVIIRTTVVSPARYSEALHVLDEAIYDTALARIGEVSPDTLEIDQLVREHELALTWRASISKPPTQAEQREYQNGVEEDRAYVQKKFFPTRTRQVKHAGWRWQNPMSAELRTEVKDLAPNDTGLPAASITPAAVALEAWCKKASWGICSSCGAVQPQHLKESATRSLPGMLLRHCKNCQKDAAKRAWVPSPEDVPEPLRGLSRRALEALRPLDVDCGPEWKADYGYYFHSTMLRLAWSARDVEEKIRDLDPGQRAKAKEALCILVATL